MTYIIFDADNTLYNLKTEKAYYEMFRYIADNTEKSIKEVQHKFNEKLKVIKRSKNPEKRRREYLINLLFPEVNEKEAVSIFWQNLTISPAPGVFHFLNKIYNAGVKGIIISEEFKQPLVKKLYAVFGRMWKEYFRIIITADDAKEMKPSLKYYDVLNNEFKISEKEIILAVGDDFEKDLSIPKQLNIKTAIYQKQDHRADIWFQDYKTLEKMLNIK